jgi:hypothetical protein
MFSPQIIWLLEQADVSFECREVDKYTVQPERGYPIADGFLRIRATSLTPMIVSMVHLKPARIYG